MAEQHSFIFPIANLRTLVEKRTTVLGANRSADGEPHQIERLSMTKGEKFLFDDYLQEAAAETYNWIRAFGRNIANAYKVYPAGELIQVAENNGAKIMMGGNVQPFPAFTIPVSISMLAIRHNLQLSDPSAGLHVYNVNVHLPNIYLYLGRATEMHVDVHVHYTTIADGIFEDAGAHTIRWNITEDAEEQNSLMFTLSLQSDDFDKKLKSIDSVEIVVTDVIAPKQEFKRGDYIEVTTKGGLKMYGIVTTACDDIPVAEWLPGDLRDSIVYKVELPDWQDRNMLPSVENHLQEAIVNYIMWRWFENTNPKEAEVYYEKWEDKAHKAQLGLNAEQKVLQRKSTWL